MVKRVGDKEKILLKFLGSFNDELEALNDKTNVFIELEKSNSKRARSRRPVLPGFPSFEPQDAGAQKTENKRKQTVEINLSEFYEEKYQQRRPHRRVQDLPWKNKTSDSGELFKKAHVHRPR